MPALDSRSHHLRKKILDTLNSSRRGHIGSAFSLVEIMRTLYDDILKYDSKNPNWPDRDRFILSKGHGCLAQYVLLAEKGFITEEALMSFCKTGSILGGHPDHFIPGVETSSGSLGHGLSIGVGMALSARIDKTEHRIFVVIGDGESNEGSVWEAAMAAGKHGLSNLIVLIDYNKMQSYGSTYEVQNLEPLADKWKSFGFAAFEIDGHDPQALGDLLRNLPRKQQKPTIIICHTVKGRGVDFIENNPHWHHKSKVTDDEMSALYDGLEASA